MSILLLCSFSILRLFESGQRERVRSEGDIKASALQSNCHVCNWCFNLIFVFSDDWKWHFKCDDETWNSFRRWKPNWIGWREICPNSQNSHWGSKNNGNLTVPRRSAISVSANTIKFNSSANMLRSKNQSTKRCHCHQIIVPTYCRQMVLNKRKA